MAIRQDDNRPSRRFGLINLLLIGFGVLLLFSNFLPNPAMQVPRVPYSLFIDQVNDDNVKRAFITSDQIRYELKKPPAEGAPTVLATTPIFDMELPQRLEQLGGAAADLHPGASVLRPPPDGRCPGCPELHQIEGQGVCAR
jgi:cell division protease FtsH